MNLSSLDLNLLLVLHAVLEEGSVARAAERLHVSSPAISNSLARLRALLDDPLLVRSGRGLVPTPRAKELAPILARIVEDTASVVHGPAGDPAASTRELTLALTDADQVASLPRLAGALARAMPRARLRAVSVDTLISSGGLEGGAADAAIGPEEAASGLRSSPLYEEEAVLVVRRGHPILKKNAVKPKVTREAFNALRHVDVHLALGRGGAGHRVAEDAFARFGLVRDVAITVPTFTAAAMVAASTDLMAGLPRRVVASLAKVADLVIVEAPLPVFRFTMQLMWHERTHLDPVAQRFRATITEALGPAPKARRATRA